MRQVFHLTGDNRSGGLPLPDDVIVEENGSATARYAGQPLLRFASVGDLCAWYRIATNRLMPLESLAPHGEAAMLIQQQQDSQGLS